MKKLLFIICFIIAGIVHARAEKFKIVALNTPQITISGKSCRIGDVFEDRSNIKWIDDKQSMEVKELSTGTLYRFSKKVFDSKSVLSIADYFKETKQASTRGSGRLPLFKHSAVKDKFPERRIALVIGNSDYSDLPYLRNAQKDASDIANLLLDLGFDVVEAYECNYADMRTALNNFSSKAGNYDVALFYYAGHGSQYENRNYLVPVDCPLDLKSDLRNCLDAEDVLERLDSSGAGARLVFLDACRNTKKSWTRASDVGLARMEGSIGSVIMFSTQSGQVAYDGDGGENSPFATSLMKNLALSEIKFPETMQGIVRDTYTLTGQKQYPLQVGTLITDFRFNPTIVRPSQPKYTATDGTAKENYDKGYSYYSEKNYTEALKWFTKAAEQNYAPAQLYLGYMYFNGMGITQNDTEAAKWYRKSAEQNYAIAQCNLGYMYEKGLGVTMSYDEAVKWYRKSAEQNNAIAQNNLGVMYEYGRGITMSYDEAVKWFRKSAEQNYAIAQCNLGYMYSKGKGITQNDTEAVKWYRKSAEQNDARAKYYLGLMYENGRGVEKDLTEAIKWYDKSASQGYEYAKKALKRLNREE